MFEENDPEQAAKYFLQAAQNGAPSWLPSLAARLYTKAGQKEAALVILKDLLRRAEEADQEQIAEEYKKRIARIEGESAN